MNHIGRYRVKRIPGRGSSNCQAVGKSICPAGEWGTGRRPVWETTGGFWDFSRDPSGGCADYRLQGGGGQGQKWGVRLSSDWYSSWNMPGRGFMRECLPFPHYTHVFPVLRNFWKTLNTEWLDSILHSPERTHLSWRPDGWNVLPHPWLWARSGLWVISSLDRSKGLRMCCVLGLSPCTSLWKRTCPAGPRRFRDTWSRRRPTHSLKLSPEEPSLDEWDPSNSQTP